MDTIIHIAVGRGYRYKGVTLEWHNYLGPTVLNRHSEEERNYKNISLRIWGIVNQFAALSKEDKELYRIY
ncbi:hypothetical protein VPHK479_0082 [Vibrio phage K479]